VWRLGGDINSRKVHTGPFIVLHKRGFQGLSSEPPERSCEVGSEGILKVEDSARHRRNTLYVAVNSKKRT
jgi:hypothetical protein